jgi:putative DNA primase/helicase
MTVNNRDLITGVRRLRREALEAGVELDGAPATSGPTTPVEPALEHEQTVQEAPAPMTGAAQSGAPPNVDPKLVAAYAYAIRLKARLAQTFHTADPRDLFSDSRLSDLVAALYTLNIVAGEYDRWRNIGWAFRHAAEVRGIDPEQAFAAWHEWCKTQPRYDGVRPCRLVWDSYNPSRPNGITEATFWHEVQIAPPSHSLTAVAQPPAAVETAAPSPLDDPFADWDEPERAQLREAASQAITALRTAPLTTCATNITPRKVDWLWRDHLARGQLHLLAGAPDAGKSTAALAIATAITRGASWPDGTQAPQGDCLIYASEDDAECTIVPRLIAAGADLNRVHFLQSVSDLASAVEQLKPLLVVLDPITSGIKQQNDQTHVRDQLEPIAVLARRADAAILGITHFGKRSSDLPSTERVLGSTAFVAVARIVFAMAEGDLGPVFACIKNNLSRKPQPRAYFIESCTIDGDIETSRLLWGQCVAGTADEVLRRSDPTERQQRKLAREFLEQSLADGPKSSTELFLEARQLRISEKTLRRARDEMKGRIRVEKQGAKWMWGLANEGDER